MHEYSVRILWRSMAFALVAGVLLGSLDLGAQVWLPYPWANLANSSAVWAVVAFAVGRRIRGPWWAAGLAGAVTLVVAVPVYYATAAVFLGDDLANLWAPTSVLWTAFGLFAGAGFGVAASWSLGRHPVRKVLGQALPSAILLAEAAVVAISRSGISDADHRTDSLLFAGVEVALAIAAAGVVGRRRILAVLAVSVPVAAACCVAFRLTGFGG